MRQVRPTESSSLTEWERLGLHQDFNLADGHAHQTPTPAQLAILQNFPRYCELAESVVQEEHEGNFAAAFFAAAGQHSFGSLSPATYHYSSSVSIDILAKALACRSRVKVALLDPTFDNIPLLLRRNGLSVSSLSTEIAWGSCIDDLIHRLANVDALFVVAPNNPTGITPTPSEFERLVDACLATSTTLCVDSSFRFFTDLVCWDQYMMYKARSDLSFALIEDTGKTWPTQEMKIGALVVSRDLSSVVDSISDEIILNVSPVVLQMLTDFARIEIAERAERGCLSLAAETAAANRAILRTALAGTSIRAPFEESTISVEWLQLPENWDSVEVAQWLATHGVGVLPGVPFHWNSRPFGRQWLRVALMRDPAYFKAGVEELTTLLSDYAAA